MKTLRFAWAACLIAASALAANPPREASDIWKQYEEVQRAAFSLIKSANPDNRRTDAEDLAAARSKRYELAKELYTSHPDFPRARSVMYSELVIAIGSGQAAKA